MNNKQISFIDSPIGTIELCAKNGFIHHIKLLKRKSTNLHNTIYDHKSPLLLEASREIDEYFEGTRKVFDIPFKLNTPPFYTKVLLAVSNVKYGEILSYSEIARIVGNCNAVRAVGTANANNPLPILIPCHRIILSNGMIGEYSGGVDKKSFLLEHECHNLY